MTGYLLFAIAVVIVALLCDPHAFDPDNGVALAESLRPVID